MYYNTTQYTIQYSSSYYEISYTFSLHRKFCNMVDAGKDWLEAILLKRAHEESPIKVLDLETSDTSGVVAKGENYMSKIRRIRAKVLLGSGKVKKLSFIVKNQHDTEAMKKFCVDLGVFQREITVSILTHTHLRSRTFLCMIEC